MNKQEQVTPRMDLQFFAEPGPETATPPVSDYVPLINDSSQAPVVNDQTPPNQPVVNQSVNNTIPQDIANNQFYKDAVRGMNTAQQESAGWRKMSEQFGGLTPEQASQAIEVARYLATNRDQAFAELAQQIGSENAMRLIMGQGQAQVQTQNQFVQPNQGRAIDRVASQYGPESQGIINDIYSAVKEDLMKEVNQQYGPMARQYSEQNLETMIGKATSIIEEVAKMVGKSGDQQFIDQVFAYAEQNQVPPNLIRGAAIEVLGGPEKLIELAKNQVLQSQLDTVNRNQQNTSSTLAQPGITVVNQPDYSKMKPEDYWDLINKDGYQPLIT